MTTQDNNEAASALHSAIMNLRADVSNCSISGAAADLSYKQGHRDARHAAAELAAASASQSSTAGPAKGGPDEDLAERIAAAIRADLKRLENCVESLEPEDQAAFYNLRAYIIADLHGRAHVARQRQESAPLVAEAIEHAARICESLCVCDNGEDDEEINRILRNRAAQIRGLLDAKKAATPSAAVAETGKANEDTEALDVAVLLARFQQEVWNAALSERPDYDYSGRETAKEILATVKLDRHLIALMRTPDAELESPAATEFYKSALAGAMGSVSKRAAVADGTLTNEGTKSAAAVAEGVDTALPRPDCTYADHSYPAYSKKAMEAHGAQQREAGRLEERAKLHPFKPATDALARQPVSEGLTESQSIDPDDAEPVFTSYPGPILLDPYDAERPFSSPVEDRVRAVHFYRQKGCTNWIECVTDPRETLSASAAASCFEYRTLYATPATEREAAQQPKGNGK